MDVFDSLGVDEEEAEKVLKDIEASKAVQDRRICICGHPMVRHEFDRTLSQHVCT
jgi:hypothetical protein